MFDVFLFIVAVLLFIVAAIAIAALVWTVREVRKWFDRR